MLPSRLDAQHTFLSLLLLLQRLLGQLSPNNIPTTLGTGLPRRSEWQWNEKCRVQWLPIDPWTGNVSG